MGEISRVALFGKLNSLGYKAIEGATVFCKMRGNPYVELVHWLHQILQLQDSRPAPHRQALRHRRRRGWREDLTADARPAAARRDLDLRSLVAHRRRGRARLGLRLADVRRLAGAHRPPGRRHPEDAGACATRCCGISQGVRQDQAGRRSPDEFAQDLSAARPKTRSRASDGSHVGGGAAPGEASGAMPPAQMGKQEALKQFAVDLTEQARKGEIDPIVGRDEEIRQIVDILMRRRQNNPILTGEAGVGKTAVVEGFALRIAARRRAAAAEGRVAALARHRPAAGRRQHEGRVREPPAPGDRRGAGLAQADHPVHRRGAHADRRRRRGRHRRRGQPAQAGAGARHAAHHRAPPPGPNTRSTSRRTRRSPGASRSCRSTSRARRRRS